MHVILDITSSSSSSAHSMDMDPISTLQHTIIETLNFFLQKYDEEFERFLETFFNMTKAIIIVKSELKEGESYSERSGNDDVLIIAGLNLLSTVSSKGNYAQVFGSEEIVDECFKHLIVPSFSYNENDLELVEFNPTEFIRFCCYVYTLSLFFSKKIHLLLL